MDFFGFMGRDDGRDLSPLPGYIVPEELEKVAAEADRAKAQLAEAERVFRLLPLDERLEEVHRLLVETQALVNYRTAREEELAGEFYRPEDGGASNGVLDPTGREVPAYISNPMLFGRYGSAREYYLPENL